MSGLLNNIKTKLDQEREEGWRPLWADFNNKANNPPKGYKTELMYSDYDGSPIKWRHVKET